MKKKLLSGIIVASVVALTALNLDMGIGSRWFSGVSLAAIEGMADDEVVHGTRGMRMESYLCRQDVSPNSPPPVVFHQKVCESFTQYSSYCSKSDEVLCENHDITTGVGSNWYN